MTVTLFGREEEFEYSERHLGYAILGLRLVMGWTLFYAGITKVLDPSWTAQTFLNSIPPANPFQHWFMLMAGDPVVDLLVQWGLTLTGLGVLLGALLRTAAFWGAVMMLLFWAAAFPLDHAFLVDDHIVYVLLLFGLGAFGAGRLFGVDGWLEKQDAVQERPWLRYLLG